MSAVKKIIWTICIALLAAACAVMCKNIFSCRIPIHNRGIDAVTKAGDLRVLFIGSSTFRSNLDIDLLDEAFDDRAYILAYGGNQYIACDIQYDELKERSDHTTDLLVLEFDPLLLTEEVKLSDSRVIWDLSWNGKKRLWEKMADSGNADFDLFFEYFVSAGMDDLITYPVTEPFYATRYNKGAKTGETPSSGKAYLENEPFDISEVKPVSAQEEALFDLIAKCETDRQNYVLLESPHYHRLQEDPVYVKYHAQFEALLKEKNVPCIFAEDVNFDDHEAAYYEDMGHMSSEGRRVYTQELIPLLMNRQR
ncbi:MAG: hypothetical protein K6E16_05945 [Lachnospiraceae bacterium]|nr:hypothetical protein [Lachnospiraceae bacterium]